MAASVPTVREEFKALSPAQFFARYREIAGFSNPTRALYQAIRELVENALDATDSHGILPSVKIIVRQDSENPSHYVITVEDNGIGIPPQHVPQAFGRVLYSSKYVLRQTRGMFGLGVKAAIIYGQLTTGKPVEVITSQPGLKRIYYFKLRIDLQKNQPIILERGSWRKSRDWHGTIVSITIEGDWSRAKQKIIEYIKRTAVITPYANIVFVAPDGVVLFYKRNIEQLPPPSKEVKPHPHGIDLEFLKTLKENKNFKTVKDLLINSFQGVGEKTAIDVLILSSIDPSISPSKLTERDLVRLAETLKAYKRFRAPKADALSPLGREIIKAGLRRIFEPEFVEAITRRPAAYQGHPFIIEVGIAYGGKVPMSSDDGPILLRYANKIPLLYDEKSDVSWKVVSKSNFDWSQYNVSLPAQLIVLTHICSTKIPFKGVGKESVADVPEIEKELRLALREVARKLRIYLSKKIREEEKKRRIIVLARYIPEVARNLAIIASNGKGDKVDGILLEKLSEIIARRTGADPSEIIMVAKQVEVGV
ncbi:MAG: DNA topoisomerase VI subunit B [Desulfurococcales archaeon]|nr:DNA topoisomerase VI subunit B [Desulfurococcales archaeon]